MSTDQGGKPSGQADAIALHDQNTVNPFDGRDALDGRVDVVGRLDEIGRLCRCRIRQRRI